MMGLMQRWTESSYQRMTLMQRMIERLEVDTVKVVCDNFGTTFRSIVGRCRGCSEAETCVRWLDGKDAGTTPLRFCPNAKTFASYQRH